MNIKIYNNIDKLYLCDILLKARELFSQQTNTETQIMNETTTLHQYLSALADANPPANDSGITLEQNRARRIQFGASAPIRGDGIVSQMMADALFEAGGIIIGLFRDAKDEIVLAHYQKDEWVKNPAKITGQFSLRVPCREENVWIFTAHSDGSNQSDRKMTYHASPIHLNMFGRPIRGFKWQSHNDWRSCHWAEFPSGTAGWVDDAD